MITPEDRLAWDRMKKNYRPLRIGVLVFVVVFSGMAITRLYTAYRLHSVLSPEDAKAMLTLFWHRPQAAISYTGSAVLGARLLTGAVFNLCMAFLLFLFRVAHHRGFQTSQRLWAAVDAQAPERGSVNHGRSDAT